jgi:hypothetical protein
MSNTGTVINSVVHPDPQGSKNLQDPEPDTELEVMDPELDLNLTKIITHKNSNLIILTLKTGNTFIYGTGYYNIFV